MGKRSLPADAAHDERAVRSRSSETMSFALARDSTNDNADNAAEENRDVIQVDDEDGDGDSDADGDGDNDANGDANGDANSVSDGSNDPRQPPENGDVVHPHPHSSRDPVFARGLGTSFASWEEFETALSAFCKLTSQSFGTRTSTSVASRNKQIRARSRGGGVDDRVDELPESWKFYSRTLMCKHAMTFTRKKGTNAQSTHDPGCTAQLNVTVSRQRDHTLRVEVRAVGHHGPERCPKVTMLEPIKPSASAATTKDKTMPDERLLAPRALSPPRPSPQGDTNFLSTPIPPALSASSSLMAVNSTPPSGGSSDPCDVATLRQEFQMTYKIVGQLFEGDAPAAQVTWMAGRLHELATKLQQAHHAAQL